VACFFGVGRSEGGGGGGGGERGKERKGKERKEKKREEGIRGEPRTQYETGILKAEEACFLECGSLQCRSFNRVFTIMAEIEIEIDVDFLRPHDLLYL